MNGHTPHSIIARISEQKTYSHLDSLPIDLLKVLSTLNKTLLSLFL